MKKSFLLLYAVSVFLFTGCQNGENELLAPFQEEAKPIQTHTESKPVVEYFVRFPENAGSEMLCPFTIDVYPGRILAGDPVYIRLNFVNTKDHTVFAPAEMLNRYVGKTGVLTYYFSDNVSIGKGNEYVWKTYWGTGDWLWRIVWEKISPGEKGLTQYEILQYQHSASLKCWDEIKDETRVGTLGWMTRGVNVRGTRGRLKIVLSSLPSHPFILTQLHGVSSHELLIIPRPVEEMELIETFFENKAPKQVDVGNWQFNATKEEMQDFRDKISSGTLQNYIQFHIFLNEFRPGIEKGDIPVSEYMKILDEMEQWFGTLHELERENLKVYARFLTHHLERKRTPESLLEKCNSIFGEYHPIPEGWRMLP